MATIIDLSDLGDRGFMIRGAQRGDRAGYSVAPAGDVNGDGLSDLIVSSPWNAPGRAYVIFGSATGLPDIDLEHLAPESGFTIRGDPADFTGVTVASAGDINVDGLADVIVGASGHRIGSENRGAAFIVFGSADARDVVSLDHLDPRDGLAIVGASDDRSLGESVASAGDVNGDGLDDLILGSPYNGLYGGHAYVVYGRPGGLANTDLSDLKPKTGFLMFGEGRYDFSGYSVASAGDFDGDGFSDVIVGNPHGDDRDGFGQTYVVFGARKSAGPLDLYTLDEPRGFTVSGYQTNSALGASVSSAGDVNGDGFDDLIIGASGAKSGSRSVGAAYVIFGHAGPVEDVDVSNLSADDGFALIGSRKGESVGLSVASAGDVNGDGFADVIVGATGADGGGKNAGAAYVIFGKADGFHDIDLRRLGAADGFVIQGATADDAAGRRVASAGDLNGDGFADVVVGAIGDDAGGKDAGAAYVVFGAAPTESVTRVGTDIGQTIHGGLGDDTLDGRGGDDTLVAAEGNDSADGGAGNDVLFGNAGDDRLSGGDGADSLHGGSGRDVLTGGDGADVFFFIEKGVSPEPDLPAQVTDLRQSDGDLIDLTSFDADTGTRGTDPFTFVGTAAFSGAAGELRFEVVGGDTLVSGDTNGDTVPDFVIRLTGTVALTAADFVFPGAPSPAGAHPFLAHADIAAHPLIHLA